MTKDEFYEKWDEKAIYSQAQVVVERKGDRRINIARAIEILKGGLPNERIFP